MKLQTAITSLFAICILLVFNDPVLGNEERDEALRMLKQYKESQKWFEKFSIQMITTYRSISPVHELEPSKRVEATIKKWGSFLSISGVQELLSRKFDSDPRKVQKIHKVVNDKMGVFLGHEIDKQPKGASVTANISKALDRNITDWGFNGSILEGYMNKIDGKCLADLVLEADDVSTRGVESINGFPCIRIFSKTRYGSVELWLDEKNGYLPRQYVFRKSADDFYSDGQKLRESDFWWEGQSNIKGVFRSEDSRILDRVEIGKEAGLFFIKSGRIIASSSLSNGNNSSYETTYKRTKFDPTPNFSENDFKIDLPNGMSIYNEDDPNSGVAYEWQDGRIVPAYSDFSASTEGKWSKTSGFLVFIWLVGGIVLLAASLWYIWRYKMARG